MASAGSCMTEDGKATARHVCMQGKLHVSRRNPREGVVQIGSSGSGGGSGGGGYLGRLVRISGRMDLNRAMDGDMVVVRVKPAAAGQAIDASSAANPIESLADPQQHARKDDNAEDEGGDSLKGASAEAEVLLTGGGAAAGGFGGAGGGVGAGEEGEGEGGEGLDRMGD